MGPSYCLSGIQRSTESPFSSAPLLLGLVNYLVLADRVVHAAEELLCLYRVDLSRDSCGSFRSQVSTMGLFPV